MKLKSEVAQSCPTLSNPMDCSLRGSSVHGISQARVLEWGAVAFFGQSEWLLSKSLQIINAGKGMEKREPSYTIGGNANQYSHYGEQCGDSFKNWKQNCHMTQQSHCWAYTPRKPELKETCVPQCSSQHCLQQLGHESNLNVHQVMNVVVHMHNGILLRH